VRPEKISFGEPGAGALAARVTNRVFQGNHWLLPAGDAARRRGW